MVAIIPINPINPINPVTPIRQPSQPSTLPPPGITERKTEMAARNPEPDLVPSHQNWTTAALSYNDVIGKTTLHGTHRLISIISSLHPFTPSLPALDLGCGSGSLTLAIRTHSPSTPILAVDISPGMLAELSRHRLPGVSTLLDDATSLSSLPDARFSHGLSSFCIQFSADARACVRSLCRVTRPGGVVGIAIWGERVGMARLHERACANLDPAYVPPPQTTGTAWHDERRHRAELEGAGLEAVRTEVVEMPFEAGGEGGVVEYWFRSTNPVPRKMVGHWEEAGGDRGALEGEYARLVGEVYARGERVVCEAVLGWGRKPGG